MGQLKQEIYDHGGSRITYDINGDVCLIADTYLDDEAFSVAVKESIEEYFDKIGDNNDV